ncbi:MAG: hypothetical protein HRT45_01880 [Bdellovibrionales bacterium]|nr:hypothetical protein [Bdellovibrionales bacterium]
MSSRFWFIVLVIMCLPSLANAQLAGVYHSLLTRTDCPQQAIIETEQGYRNFFQNYSNALLDTQDNTCDIIFSLNMTSYIRHLILADKQDAYNDFFGVLVDEYDKAALEDVGAGRVCAEAGADGSVHVENIQICRSDRMVEVADIANRVWYEFFFREQAQQSALGSSFVTLGVGALFYGALAYKISNFRTKITKIVKHVKTLIRRPQTVTVTGRSAAVGGAVATTGEKEVEIVRSTTDYPSPMEYFNGDRTRAQRVGDKLYGVLRNGLTGFANFIFSFSMLVTGEDDLLFENEQLLGYQMSSGAEEARDILITFTFAMAPYVLGEKIAERIMGDWFTDKTLDPLPENACRSTLVKRNFTRAGRWLGRFGVGVVAGTTAAIGLNLTAISALERKQFEMKINNAFAEVERLKARIREINDPTDPLVYRLTQELVDLATVQLVPTLVGGRMLALDKVKKEHESSMMCGVLSDYYRGRHLTTDVDRENKARPVEFEEKVDEVFANEVTSGYFDRGWGLLMDTLAFIRGFDQEEYHGLKTPIYDLQDQLLHYRTATRYNLRLRGRHAFAVGKYSGHARALSVIKRDYQAPPKGVVENVTEAEWQSFFQAQDHFNMAKEELADDDLGVSCLPLYLDKVTHYNLFFDNDKYQSHVPCSVNHPSVNAEFCKAN